MSKACNDMDWEYIEGELRRLKLLTFAKTCMSLCEKWFKVEMPFHLDKMDEDFFQSITEKTFQDGVFGLDNKDNKTANAAKDLKRSTSPYHIAAAKRILRKLFPPYEDMQLIPWYSFVDGRTWLMPAAWVYRWIYCIIHKRKHGADLLMEPFLRKDLVRERQAYLKKWGL